MKTIGEHAHNAAVVSRLREIGVDAAQGFAFGQPRPLDQLRLRDSHAIVAENTVARVNGTRAHMPALLRGLIFAPGEHAIADAHPQTTA